MRAHKIAYPFVALALTSCGISPLFNHRQAAPASSAATGAISSANAACPIVFPKAGLCASLEWMKKPTEDQTGSLGLRFWNSTGASASGPYRAPAQKVAVKLWMASMGHGSSPVSVQPTTTPGVFEATGVYFSMPGDWEIWVQLKNGNEIVEQAKIDYRA